jgi:multifunctional methyltransferase subunit TRM112
MKPFLVSLLKCKRCTFMTELRLSAERVDEKDVDMEETRVINEQYYTQDNGEKLKSLVSRLKGFQVPMLSDEEIESFVKDPSDSMLVRTFLFGCDVVEGSLTCSECGLVYPIRDSILDTVDTRTE